MKSFYLTDKGQILLHAQGANPLMLSGLIYDEKLKSFYVYDSNTRRKTQQYIMKWTLKVPYKYILKERWIWTTKLIYKSFDDWNKYLKHKIKYLVFNLDKLSEYFCSL